ncbi:hypothetical protein HMPREF1219_01913 [Corynebacterium pyruviciproducens ATCC BAA-1742]|uniref:Uncharacterized protein n=1 Tax=Corynebacterium pyruviciproducens ATCC BAA-1742 TaxID=1125779 RepID=S2ZE65_9CORY|nr:hypothetical protein [Corynebacterium pyruviciproducens]EPD68267.1 hypothetical protein HMPREF1219_01913 [Corynebacterium pyruviciproducens ATCC BAA-1742]
MKKLSTRTVAAVLSTSLAVGMCVPAANAATVKITDNKCSISFTAEESNRIPEAAYVASDPITFNKASLRAKATGADIAAQQVALKNLDNRLAAHRISQDRYNHLANPIKERIAELTVLNQAYNKCAQGKEGDTEPIPQDQSPDSALSTADGHLNDAGKAVVAVSSIVVILGLIIAILPQLKPLLPPQIQAMLP